MKIVTCHLGNGSSITAIDGGKSVDTSMGFTPLDGIIMGTRSGGIDPSVVTYLQEKENLDAKDVGDLLNKKSGYLGVSGVTSDQRDLTASAESGNARSQLALDIQRYQIKKYIGAYAAAMGGLDYVIFTGGIGENTPNTRTVACEGLEFLGIKLDEEVNQATRGELKDISASDAKVRVFIVPTNEELLIARDTKELVSR
jgi:acetate kinase